VINIIVPALFSGDRVDHQLRCSSCRNNGPFRFLVWHK